MLVAWEHTNLCDHHARLERRDKEENVTARQAMLTEVLGPITDFRTASSVNHALGKLLTLALTERIPARNAGVVAYICQLLLQSVPRVQDELWRSGRKDEKKEVDAILNAPSIHT